MRQHQQAIIGALFRAGFDALATLCLDPKWLGGRIGALAVLHTWTRTLEWHPHVHLLVPAGGVAPDGHTRLRSATAKTLLRWTAIGAMLPSELGVTS